MPSENQQSTVRKRARDRIGFRTARRVRSLVAVCATTVTHSLSPAEDPSSAARAEP